MKRNYKISPISVTAEELQRAKANAEAFGYTLSGFIRALATARIFQPNEIPQVFDKVIPRIVLQQGKRKGLRANKQKINKLI